MNGRRGLLTAMALAALAGVVALVASGRTWGHAVITTPSETRVSLSVSGHDAEAALPALGIGLIVLAGAILAARRWLRRVIGVVVVVLGGAVIALAVAARDDVASELTSTAQRTYAVADAGVAATTSAWAIATMIAGALAVLAGAATAVVGHRWPALGSRYDAPAARAERAGESSAWDALDRGEDPTV